MLTSPLFELDFKDKTEYIFCHYFRIAPFAYRPNKMDKYEEVLTSDKFKTSEEYHKYILKMIFLIQKIDILKMINIFQILLAHYY